MPNPTLEAVLNSNNPLTVMTASDLDSLSSGSSALSAAAFSNVIGDSNGCGFVEGRLQFHSGSLTVSAGGYLQGWLLCAPDGSTYEQGGTSVTPNRPPDFIISPVAQTAVVDVQFPGIEVPICANIKVLLQNELGAALSSSGCYLKLWLNTDSYPTGQV